MKRMLKLLIVIFILYFTIQYLFYYFGRGHNITYIIKNGKDIVIEEEMTSYSNISDGYFFNIKFDNYSIPFKTLKQYNKQKRMVSKVNLYYGDKYICAEIQLKKDSRISDIKCLKDNVLYYYNTIRGNDSKLDNLIDSSNYEILSYTNDIQAYDKDKIKYYPNNYIDEYNLVLSYYKGLYLFGKGVLTNARFISLFTNDQYTKELEGIVDNYYIVADYNYTHEFYNFYLINIITGSNTTLISPKPISFSSFIQGSNDGKLYLIDTQSKQQYIIDSKKKKIELIGDINSRALIYTKEGWITKNMDEVIDKRITFNTDVVESINGIKFDNLNLIGNEYGIYYYYVKNGISYDAYMIYAQDKNQIKHYLFSTTDINRIKYREDNVYYIYNDEIRSYGPRTGIRTIIKFSELKFNSKLNYFVY